jgi:hypothetical protein
MGDIINYMGIKESGDADALFGRQCYPLTHEDRECLGRAQPLCCDRIYPVRTFDFLPSSFYNLICS